MIMKWNSMKTHQKKKNRLRAIRKPICLLTAVLYGKAVSPKRIKKRIKVCEQCMKVEYFKNHSVMKCGICGCLLSKKNALINLARYEETKRYGCKHPDGSKWKGI